MTRCLDFPPREGYEHPKIAQPRFYGTGSASRKDTATVPDESAVSKIAPPSDLTVPAYSARGLARAHCAAHGGSGG